MGKSNYTDMDPETENFELWILDLDFRFGF